LIQNFVAVPVHFTCSHPHYLILDLINTNMKTFKKFLEEQLLKRTETSTAPEYTEKKGTERQAVE
jgi:hypothetical protein